MHILVKHTVEDFDTWKPGFDDHASTRVEYGSQGYTLFRDSADPNELIILMEWDSAENAQRFMEESDLKERMEELGVIGEPEITFIEEAEAKSPEMPAA